VIQKQLNVVLTPTPKSKDKDHVRQIRFFYNGD
jgi:hypothetical protein